MKPQHLALSIALLCAGAGCSSAPERLNNAVSPDASAAAGIKLSAEDRLDIIELFARYAWAIDLGDVTEVVECFTPDASFDHLWQGRVQGHEAIVKNLEALWYDRGAWWYGRQHLFNHFRFFPESADRIRMKSFFQIIQFNIEYKNYFVFGLGTRDDIVERHDGRWYFKNLFVNAWLDRGDVPWKASMDHMAPARPKRNDPTPPEFHGAETEANPKTC